MFNKKLKKQIKSLKEEINVLKKQVDLIIKQNNYLKMKNTVTDRDLNQLKLQDLKLNELICNNNIYAAMGLPYMDKYDKKLLLLIEAKNKGFFDSNNYFHEINNKNMLYKHWYSNHNTDYIYDEKTDTLKIPAVTFTEKESLCVAIYENNKWSKILKNI